MSTSDYIGRATAELGKVPSALSHVPEKAPELLAMGAGVWVMRRAWDMIDDGLGYGAASGYKSIDLPEQLYRALEETLTFSFKYVMAKAIGLDAQAPAVTGP